MSNYAQITFFAPKDLLLSGNPAKLIKGADVDPELAAISTAIATKYDSTSIASAPVGFANGTAALPSITFSAQTNLGMFRAAANDLGLSVAGVQVADFQAAVITLFNSVVAAAANLAITNTSTVATQDVEATLTAGTSVAQLYVANQNRATAVLTSGPTTAQAALYTTGSIPLVFGTNNTYRGGIDQNGAWTIFTPTGAGAIALTVNAVDATHAALVVTGPNNTGPLATFDSGGATGSFIKYRANSADVGFIGSGNRVFTATVSDFAIGAVGAVNLYLGANGIASMKLTSASISGLGPVKAGFVDMTPDTGTFTATLTGCTTAPTVTASWVRVGNLVTLYVPAVTATSNSTAMTITGLPASIQPATLTQTIATVGTVENNTTGSNFATVQVAAGSGTLTFAWTSGTVSYSTAGFTASGTKGLYSPLIISYLLI